MSDIDKAFEKVARKDFLPPEVKNQAQIDSPLPIGYGQTNSQPYTVQKMLAWLDVKPGNKVLDVGSGSGWTTALLSHLVGENGEVIAVEKVPQLVDFGQKNCQNLRLKNVSFHQSGKHFGWPKQAPYQRILVSAAADSLPKELIDQLEPGGRLVIPINNSIHVINKAEDNHLYTNEYFGFSFVPLIK